MAKIISEERAIAKKHPVSFPVFVVLGLMIICILVLGYFLYQTVAENTRLKQKYEENTSSTDVYEDGQEQQLESNLEEL